MLTVKSINKSFMSGKVKALKNVSLTFPDTGFVAIVGESGSGKTTLLNILSGIDKPDSGTIEYNKGTRNYDYGRLSDRQSLYKDYYTYILQENIFVPELNLRQNIVLASTVATGKAVDEDDSKMETLVADTGLGERLDHSYYEVSGGQRQRATLVRGLLKNAEVIFADEPTASQDEESERSVFRILKREAETKLVIMVTHSKTLAYEYCDRIVELYNGECIRNDAVKHNETDNVVINENTVIIKNPHDVNNAEWERIKNSVSEYGKVTLEISHSPIDDENKPISEKTEEKDIHNVSGQAINYKWLLFRKIFKRYAFRIVLLALAFSFLTALVGFIKNVTAKKDINRFIYDTVKANSVKEWYFLGQYYDDESEELKLYSSMTQKTTEAIIPAALPLSGVSASAELLGVDRITGIRIFEPQNKNYVFGNCSNDAFTITDFYANALIKQSSVYKDYADIIENGVVVGGKKISISGIIKTDYEEYLEYLDLEELNNYQIIKRREFVDRKEYCYGVLYMSQSMYKTLLKAHENRYVIVKTDNQSFITVVIDDSVADAELNTVRINSIAAEKHDYADLCFSLNLPSKCNIEVADDGNSEAVIYVNSSHYTDAFNFGYNLYSFVTEEPENFENYVYLLNLGNDLLTHMDEVMFKYIRFIDALAALFDNSYIVIVIILIIVLSMLPGLSAKSISKTTGLCKLWGAKFKDIVIIETYFGITYFFMVSIAYAISETVIATKGGKILSDMYGINLMNNVSFDLSELFRFTLVALTITLIWIIAASVIRYLRRIKKQIFAD